MKVVNSNIKDWSIRLLDSLCAYITAFKIILGMFPYQLVYGKACHLPMEIEYKAWWAIKKLKMDLERADVKRFLDFNELEELRNDAYLNSKISKEISKKWYDQMVARKHFQKGDKVMLYDSKLHTFLGKLKSRWIGPFTIHQVYPNGAMELLSSNESQTFKVNGHFLNLDQTRRSSPSLSLKTPEECVLVDLVSPDIVESISFRLIFCFILFLFIFLYFFLY